MLPTKFVLQYGFNMIGKNQRATKICV